MSHNRQELLGRIGRIDELRYTAGGHAVVTASLATTHLGPQRDNQERKELTTWHRIKMWGKRAEAFVKYTQVGKRIYCYGRTDHREYTDREGVKRWACEVVVEFWTWADAFTPENPDEVHPRHRNAADIKTPEKPNPMDNRGQAGGGSPHRDTGDPDIPFDDDIPF